MSRWVTSFESHAFHSSWESLKERVSSIDKTEITDNDTLTELARLEKVIEYVDKYFKLIDPDINITNFVQTLNNLNQYIVNTTSEVNNFISNRNIAHLQRANNNIDNGLSTLKQFHTILPKVSGQGIYSMLKKYNETLDEALSEIDLSTTIDSSNQIKTLKQHLIDGTDEEDSVEAQIDYMLKDTEEKHTKLIEFYNNTLNDAEYDGTTKELVEKAKNDIESYLEQAKVDTLELSNKIDNFEKYYIKVFGELNDEDERVGGLKAELEKRIEVLDKFEKEQQKIHKETLVNKLAEITKYEQEQQKHNKNLFEQIESLLPSATSAGLAKAYHEERKKFKEPIKKWNKLFISALMLMFIATFITFINISISEAEGFKIGFVEIQNFEQTMNSLLFKLPLYGPLIWLAIYASKRRSENQRLEQEYAHKEALAKSYSSYKQQIEDLKQEDQELLTKLLDKAIETISNNASESLDKKHGDSTPVHELTKSLIDALKKLKD